MIPMNTIDPGINKLEMSNLKCSELWDVSMKDPALPITLLRCTMTLELQEVRKTWGTLLNRFYDYSQLQMNL